MLGLDAFELDCDLFARDDVGAEVYIAERSAADLSANAIFITDA
jgi:hypothetical protein